MYSALEAEHSKPTLPKREFGARDAQWVKAFAAKPGDLNSFPRAHVKSKRREMTPQSCPLTSTQGVSWDMHSVHTDTMIVFLSEQRS